MRRPLADADPRAVYARALRYFSNDSNAHSSANFREAFVADTEHRAVMQSHCVELQRLAPPSVNRLGMVDTVVSRLNVQVRQHGSSFTTFAITRPQDSDADSVSTPGSCTPSRSRATFANRKSPPSRITRAAKGSSTRSRRSASLARLKEIRMSILPPDAGRTCTRGERISYSSRPHQIFAKTSSASVITSPQARIVTICRSSPSVDDASHTPTLAPVRWVGTTDGPLGKRITT